MEGKRPCSRKMSRNVPVAKTTTRTTKVKILGSAVMLAKHGITGDHALV